MYKGNAFLKAIGQEASVRTPAGWHSYYTTRHGRLLAYRKAPASNRYPPWWAEDLKDEWCIVNCWSEAKLSSTAHILWDKLDDFITLDFVFSMDQDEIMERGAALLEGWLNNARISKNTERAFVVCPRCPVRVNCNEADRVSDSTDDWHPDWEAKWG